VLVSRPEPWQCCDWRRGGWDQVETRCRVSINGHSGRLILAGGANGRWAPQQLTETA
jgi:hypothetical protein